MRRDRRQRAKASPGQAPAPIPPGTPPAHIALHPRGFTLIELLVTLAIMALVAGIAFPLLGDAMARQALTGARTALTRALTRARATARARGSAVVAQPPATLPDGVTLAWPPGGVTFFADGTASGGVIAIAGHGGPLTREAHIAIDPETGRIRVLP